MLANRRLRRVVLAFAAFIAAEYGVWVALLVYAYQHGGTTGAAAVAVAQLVPAAFVAPLAAGLADRRGGPSALRVGYLLQAVALGATAALLLFGAPSLAAYAGAVVAASAVTFTRPAQAALLPTLVDTAEQLTAANVVAGWVESAGVLAGPALAGILIALHGPGAAVALFALTVAAAAALVASVATPEARRGARLPEPSIRGRLGAGLSALRADRGLAVLVTLLGAQFVAIGALDVLVVVLAVGVLGLGSSGAGYLNAAFGLGGVLGGGATLLLIGRRGLVAPLVGAAVAWGALFAALGVRPTVVGAFVALTAAGTARSVFDVAGRTILQRTAPAAVRGRVFGVLEGLTMLGLAMGSILVSAIVALNGAKTTLVAIGALLALAAIAALARLRALERATDAPGAEIALLRRSPLFASLGAPELEALASALVRVPLAAGAAVVREGEVGDRFYLIEHGALDVSVGGAQVNELAPGDGFGEIALLRDVPRTATVTARTDATVHALDRGPFLEAVTGSRQGYEAAERVVAERLARGSAAPVPGPR